MPRAIAELAVDVATDEDDVVAGARDRLTMPLLEAAFAIVQALAPDRPAFTSDDAWAALTRDDADDACPNALLASNSHPLAWISIV